MAISSNTAKVTVPGNGSSFTFSFSPIKVFSADDLDVYEVVNATGVATLLTEGTGASNYSVSFSSPNAQLSTGSIAYPADQGTAIPSTKSVLIAIGLDLLQDTVLQNQGTYHPDVLEAALDYLTLLAIQQQEQLDRAVKFALTEETASALLPSLTAGAYLRVKSDLSGLEWTTLSTTEASASDDTPQDVSLSAGAAGTEADFARSDHVHLLPTVTTAKGGTGATTAAGARANLDVEVARVLSLFNHAL